jgi:hypothetical protein
VNDGPAAGSFLKSRPGADVRVTNNIFYGPGITWLGGDVAPSHNYIDPSLGNAPRFADPFAYDFHLTAQTPRSIVDGGVSPGVSSTGFDLTPKREYVYDATSRMRPIVGPLDLGAFEFAGSRVNSSVGSAKVTKVTTKKKAKTYPVRSSRTKKRPRSGR